VDEVFFSGYRDVNTDDVIWILSTPRTGQRREKRERKREGEGEEAGEKEFEKLISLSLLKALPI
jgi:hypothetical protein